MGIATDVATAFETPITGFIQNGVQSVGNAVAGPLALAAALYIVIMGFMITMGYVRSPVWDFIVSAIKIVFIVALVTNASEFSTYVTEIFFEDIPNGIGGALIAAGGSPMSADVIASGSPFDGIIAQGFELGTRMLDGTGFSDVAEKLLAIVTMIVIAMVAILMFAIVIYAKIALALVLAVGPLFISFALFNVTRSFTSSWVSALMNFTILQVLVYALLGLLLNIVQDVLTSTSTGGDAFTEAGVVLAVMVMSLYVAKLIPGIAASLAGAGFTVGSQAFAAGANAASAGTRAVGRSVGRRLGGQSFAPGRGASTGSSVRSSQATAAAAQQLARSRSSSSVGR